MVAEFKTAVATCVIYAAMVLVFTAISLFTAPQGSQTGIFRPVSTIPYHEVLLILLGIGLGLAASVFLWGRNWAFVFLMPVLVVLTDLDHLPSYFKWAQPIRPAHSFIFILLTVALIAMVIRRRDVEFVSLSAFFAHLSIDTGVFPPFSPIDFTYYNLNEFRIPFLVAAVAFALGAGYVGRRSRGKVD